MFKYLLQKKVELKSNPMKLIQTETNKVTTSCIENSTEHVEWLNSF